MALTSRACSPGDGVEVEVTDFSTAPPCAFAGSGLATVVTGDGVLQAGALGAPAGVQVTKFTCT